MMRAFRWLTAGAIVFLVRTAVGQTGLETAQETQPLGGAVATANVNAEAGQQTQNSGVALEFAIPTEQDYLQARTILGQRMAELNRFLGTSSADNAAAWRSYLKWDDTRAILAQSTDEADPVSLAPIVKRYESGESGLELPPFASVRTALVGYQRLLVVRTHPEVMRARFLTFVKDIERLLDQSEPLSNADRAAITVRLQWLEDVRQAPDLVARVRRAFGSANFHVGTSAETLARGLSQPFSNVSRINEYVLSSQLRGTARTDGNVTVRLIPDPNVAVIDLLMNGQTVSDTAASQGPVTVRGRGRTQVNAVKRLIIDGHGVHSTPTHAGCSTRSRICGISVHRRLGRRLIGRVANRRAQEQRPMVERISSRRAAQRFEQRVDRQVAERIAAGNSRLERSVRGPLERLNIFPRLFKLSSSRQRLNFRAWQGRQSQLAARDLPPTVPAHHLVVQLHESVVLNSSVNAIGGMTVTDIRAQQIAQQLTGSIPDGLEGDDPWSITFDAHQPLHVAFNDGNMRVAIRGQRFMRGEMKLERQVEIAATYQIKIHEGRARFERLGNVEVTYPGRRQSRLRMSDMPNNRFFSRKFDGIFRRVVEGEGIQLSDRWAKLSELKLEYVSADKGWLSLGWN